MKTVNVVVIFGIWLLAHVAESFESFRIKSMVENYGNPELVGESMIF